MAHLLWNNEPGLSGLRHVLDAAFPESFSLIRTKLLTKLAPGTAGLAISVICSALTIIAQLFY